MPQHSLTKHLLRQTISFYCAFSKSKNRSFDPSKPLMVINNTGLGDTVFTGPALCLLGEHVNFEMVVDPVLYDWVKEWNIKGLKKVIKAKKKQHDWIKDYKKTHQFLVLRSHPFIIPYLYFQKVPFIGASRDYDYSNLADKKLSADTTKHYFVEHFERIKNFLGHIVSYSNDFKKYHQMFQEDCLPLRIPYQDNLDKKIDIIVHSGGVTTKGLGSEAFLQALREIKETTNYHIVQVGSKAEVVKDFYHLKDLNLIELSGYLASARLFIGTNSGVAQIARLFSPKMIISMANSSHRRTGQVYFDQSPVAKTHTYLNATHLPCYPCQNFDMYCYNKVKFECVSYVTKEDYKKMILSYLKEDSNTAVTPEIKN